MTELSEADKEAVRRQTERLISSSQFRNSRRYTDLLRFVVEKTIAGESDILKERTLGIEVFQREPTFDTSGDSIVRVAAAEVRKRIAQYYQQEDRQGELRIELPSGSYVAHFRLPDVAGAAQAPVPTPTPIPVPVASPNPVATDVVLQKKKDSAWRTRPALVAGVVFFVTLIIAGGLFFAVAARPVDLLEPFWSSPHDTVICIGAPVLVNTQPGITDAAAATALGQPAANNAVIPFGDALTLARVQSLLNEHHKAARAQLSRFTAFDDLRAGPVVLIGALDNSWTLRLTSKLRFQLGGSDGLQGYILDSHSKSNANWSVDFRIPYSDRTQDYAIVAITHDDTLDQPLILLAGVGPNGTVAAGEFLMNKADMEAVAQKAPPGWGRRNVELVLATQVIQGNSGPPRVVAAEYW